MTKNKPLPKSYQKVHRAILSSKNDLHLETCRKLITRFKDICNDAILINKIENIFQLKKSILNL